MPRATNNPASKQRRKKILDRAKGMRGRTKSTIRAATRVTDRAGAFSYRDRRVRRRDFRALWIQRINAAVRPHGLSYSKFMHLLKVKGIDLDRKALAYIAFNDIEAFNDLVTQVQS